MFWKRSPPCSNKLPTEASPERYSFCDLQKLFPLFQMSWNLTQGSLLLLSLCPVTSDAPNIRKHLFPLPKTLVQLITVSPLYPNYFKMIVDMILFPQYYRTVGYCLRLGNFNLFYFTPKCGVLVPSLLRCDRFPPEFCVKRKQTSGPLAT